jgi:hypothetical protein
MNAIIETTTPRVVNGINVDALTALLTRVKQDASQGKTTWRVTTTWQGQTRSRADVSGFTIGGEEVSRRLRSTSTNPMNWAVAMIVAISTTVKNRS